jgi:hypothetical protein
MALELGFALSKHRLQEKKPGPVYTLIFIAWFFPHFFVLNNPIQFFWLLWFQPRHHLQEVKKELPDETERFLEIDEDVKALLRRGFEARFAKHFCCEPSDLTTWLTHLGTKGPGDLVVPFVPRVFFIAFPWRFFGDDWLPFGSPNRYASKVSTRFWCLGEAGNGKTGSHSFFGSKTMVFPAGFPKNHGFLAQKTWIPFSKFESV